MQVLLEKHSQYSILIIERKCNFLEEKYNIPSVE